LVGTTSYDYDPADRVTAIIASITMCEPTAHRFVWRVFLPPPDHPPECLREPTAAAWL